MNKDSNLVMMCIFQMDAERCFVDMNKGTVKWFSEKLGYGFIADEQGRNIFVHHSDIIGNGFKILPVGSIVEFDLYETDKGYQAKRVQICINRR